MSEILQVNTENTIELLKQELEIKKGELEEKWHFSSLEKIFIENRIYRDIEEEETWEGVLTAIDNGLKPHIKHLKRAVTEEDIIRLTEIKIKRISKFDAFKADEILRGIEEALEEVNNHLANLTEYAIDYYQNLLEKYGKGKERKTEIKDFEEINTRVVAVANEKLYANYVEGFVGTSIKKDEYVCDCSDIDDVIVFRKDGTYSVSKVSSKAFFGKNILHVAVFRKNDDRKTYNAVYTDGKSKKTYAKRFHVTSITRDKEYNITKGAPDSKLHYFTVNPNGEAEVINVYLHSAAKARNKLIEYDFADLQIKGRASLGNMVTKHPIRKVDLKEKGVSTLSGRDIWYEKNIGRLNVHERGDYLGSFHTEDQILVIYDTGEYELTDHELTNHYADKEIVVIEKFDPEKAVAILHYDGNSKNYCVKRFNIETSTLSKRFSFITEGRGSKMVIGTTQTTPIIELTTKSKTGDKKTEEVNLVDFIDIKGWKSIGNKLCGKEFVKAKLLPPPPPPPEPTPKDNNTPHAESNNVEKPKETAAPKEIKEAVKSEPKTRKNPVVEKPKVDPPELPSKEDKDKGSFTSGDQISLL